MQTTLQHTGIAILIAATALLFPVVHGTASAIQEGPIPAGDLCTPRMSLRHPDRCPQAGPGAILTRWAEMGLYPQTPLPTQDINPTLRYLPFSYLQVNKNGISIFPGVDAARDGNASRSLQPGFLYLSYLEQLDAGDGIYYQLQSGEVVRGDKVSQAKPSSFSGMQFSQTPERPFGWVIGGSYTRLAPGEEAWFSNHWLSRLDVVQIYDVQQVDGDDWYLIGPGEWIEQKLVGLVWPDPTKPEGVEEERWISINLFEQTIAVYENGQLVYATLASTGRSGAWTKPGTFQVWAKLERDTMTGGDEDSFYYLEDVPWVMYFDQARAIHGTYWHAKFGYPSSRGCVNVTTTDARWLFEFAKEGAWVHVWDPSGETPTDPAKYDAGGA